MKKYFVETSIIVHYLRGKKETIEAIERLDGELTSSFVCLAELYEGIFRVKDREKIEKGVLNFFAGMAEVYGLDEGIARSFGKLRAELKKEGSVIEDLDILITATCIASNLILVTANPKHFQRVENLEIVEII